MHPFLLCLAAAAGLVAGVPKEPEPVAPFLRHCARCHGADGGGRGPRNERLPGGRINEPARLAATDEAALAGLILGGRRAMPGFRGKLTAEEARKIAQQVLNGLGRKR